MLRIKHTSRETVEVVEELNGNRLTRHTKEEKREFGGSGPS